MEGGGCGPHVPAGHVTESGRRPDGGIKSALNCAARAIRPDLSSLLRRLLVARFLIVGRGIWNGDDVIYR